MVGENIGQRLSLDWTFVAADIKAVVDAAHARGALVKVIFENVSCKMSHKKKAVPDLRDVKADFVKTSTGYGSTGPPTKTCA